MREPDLRPVEPPGSLFAGFNREQHTVRPGDIVTGIDLRVIPEARLAGAERALAHAEATVDPTWGRQAEAHTLAYAACHETWMTEDVVAAFTGPPPPDARSWGAVIAGLSRRKLIFKTGYRLDGFGSPKPTWRAAT